MGFAGRWLMGTVAVLSGVVLASVIHKASIVGYRVEPLKELGRGSDGQSIALAECERYYRAALAWRKQTGRFPLVIEELPNRSEIATVDPWGTPYWIEFAVHGITVRSPGPDGRRATKDDIGYPPSDRR